MKLDYNDNRHPLIVFTATGEADEADVPQILKCIEAPLDGRVHATIWDLSGLTGGLGIFLRGEINQFRQKLVDANRFDQCVANAFVCNSAIVRGAVTAIGWVVDWPVETRFFKDFGKAEAWLRNKIDF